MEPAFVSLERARVASANVQAGVSPIQRNVSNDFLLFSFLLAGRFEARLGQFLLT